MNQEDIETAAGVYAGLPDSEFDEVVERLNASMKLACATDWGSQKHSELARLYGMYQAMIVAQIRRHLDKVDDIVAAAEDRR